ncbi:MAG TPA: chemotaxis protein CheW, partial [Pirellulaceae bacterium]|nr:chemotaxis protein CheW [Pirellulaceae bacterium]
MMFEDKAILAEFVVESNEHLGTVETLLLEIEAAGNEIAADAINRVFRGIHSIKGAAGFLGLTKITELAHSLENVLNRMRNREVAPNSVIVDLLLRGSDMLRTLINAIGSERGCEDDAFDIMPFVTTLDYLHEHGVCPLTTASETAPVTQPAAVPCEVVAPLASAPAIIAEAPPVVAASTTSAPAASASANTDHAAADTNIRVSVQVLDKLMNLAGELVLSRNQLLQAVGNGQAGIEAVAARVDQVTSELQEAIMQTRMQPLAHVFSRFPRVVRDLSSKLGKQCELEIHGKEVEVDKSIIEAIGDPLVHLVRNSLDHGIEMPEVRQKRGKRAGGTITLHASHQAGRVNIVVRDDGAGMDPAKLRNKAVAKGLITTEQAAALSDRDALELIFHPGFSTAEAVTDVSGRGVGMDVVKSNILKLGGTVEVSSHLGKGSEVHIKLPLTLAIIPSLIVRCGDHRFAISQASIHELVRVKGSDIATRISTIKGAEVLRLRGKLLPLLRLGKVLGATQQAHDQNTVRGLDIIVVESGTTRYGLVVDELHDSEEIVVKPLGRHLQQCPCLAGATILGDGAVALIVDVSGIASFMGLAKSKEEETDDNEVATKDAASELQATLMFTNHPSETFGIPMAVIRRLERIRAEQIDHVGGQLLLEYENISLPLVTLEDHIRAKPRPEQAWLYVVIFEFNGREIGVIVPTLDEIKDLPTNVDVRTFREPGVIGSVVVDRKAIRLVDVFELAARAYPNWAMQPQALPNKKEESRVYRILLAEDSGFFRSQVTAFLESNGYEVIGCEDGQDAWEALQEAEPPIDLVLTDIEMPRMNGFQFTERIRESADFATMPIVALTSLAGEKEVAYGRSIGIDE